MEYLSIFSRSHPGVSLEGAREMALIVETGGGSNFSKRLPGGGKLSAGVLKAQPPHVLADCAAVVFTELASQMDRVNANCFGDAAERRRLREIGMQ